MDVITTLVYLYYDSIIADDLGGADKIPEIKEIGNNLFHIEIPDKPIPFSLALQLLLDYGVERYQEGYADGIEDI